MTALVGIVVVNYNALEHSRTCLASLLLSDYPRFQVFFVDNGSTDGSGDRIRSEYDDDVNYLRSDKNLGVTGGNNIGIRRALESGADYVLLLNNDTTVPSALVSTLVACSVRHRGALVLPTIRVAANRRLLDQYMGTFDWWRARVKNFEPFAREDDVPPVSVRVETCSTCCLLVPRATFEEIGLMDEAYFMYLDDTDFTIRATQAGYEIWYEPEAHVLHVVSGTTGGSTDYHPFIYYHYYRNMFYLYSKQCPQITSAVVGCTRIVVTLARDYVRALLKGDLDKCRIIRWIAEDVITRRWGARYLERAGTI